MRISTALAAALALALAAASPQAFAAAGAQVLNGRQQFVDLGGQPIVGGKVWIYQPGTTTSAATYQDPALTVANTSPVVLDGRGQASIWAAPGSYRELVQDAQGDVIWDQPTVAIGATVAALTPGAAIGAGGDVSCPGQLFTGAAAVTLACTLAPVANGKLAAAPVNTVKGYVTGASTNPADLTADQITPIIAASNAQAAQGQSALRVLTPANFVGAGQSNAVNGYATLPGGVILQWGHYDCGAWNCYGGGPVSVSFPLTFPNGCYSVNALTDNNGNASSPTYAMQAVSVCGAAGVSLSATGYQSAAHNAIEGFYWFAVGH